MMPLKESMNSPNSPCWKMSSFSLLSSFHLWDPSLGIFIYCIKDRVKAGGGVTQTFFCIKQKHYVACVATGGVECASLSALGFLYTFSWKWNSAAGLFYLQTEYVPSWEKACQFLLTFLTLQRSGTNTFKSPCGYCYFPEYLLESIKKNLKSIN